MLFYIQVWYCFKGKCNEKLYTRASPREIHDALFNTVNKCTITLSVVKIGLSILLWILYNIITFHVHGYYFLTETLMSYMK